MLALDFHNFKFEKFTNEFNASSYREIVLFFSS